VIETRDAADYFDNFISLYRGSRLIVAKSTLSLFRSICFELGNLELLDCISDLKEHEPTLTESLEILKLLSEFAFCSGFDEFAEKLISVCSLQSKN
jgi:hypothetical protein